MGLKITEKYTDAYKKNENGNSICKRYKGQTQL